MSDNSNTTEKEAPFLTLTGQLTADARVRAYRASALRVIIIRALIFIGLMAVMTVGINLYYGLPAFTFSTLFSGPVFWILLAVLIAVYAAEGLWLRPRKIRKTLTELYGDAEPWETKYEFYEKGLTYRVVSDKSSPDIHLDYTDLKKLKVYPLYIFLQTKANNKMSFTRAELSPEDGQKLLETLRERSGIE